MVATGLRTAALKAMGPAGQAWVGGRTHGGRVRNVAALEERLVSSRTGHDR